MNTPVLKSQENKTISSMSSNTRRYTEKEHKLPSTPHSQSQSKQSYAQTLKSRQNQKQKLNSTVVNNVYLKKSSVNTNRPIFNKGAHQPPTSTTPTFSQAPQPSFDQPLNIKKPKVKYSNNVSTDDLLNDSSSIQYSTQTPQRNVLNEPGSIMSNLSVHDNKDPKYIYGAQPMKKNGTIQQTRHKNSSRHSVFSNSPRLKDLKDIPSNEIELSRDKVIIKSIDFNPNNKITETSERHEKTEISNNGKSMEQLKNKKRSSSHYNSNKNNPDHDPEFGSNHKDKHRDTKGPIEPEDINDGNDDFGGDNDMSFNAEDHVHNDPRKSNKSYKSNQSRNKNSSNYINKSRDQIQYQQMDTQESEPEANHERYEYHEQDDSKLDMLENSANKLNNEEFDDYRMSEEKKSHNYHHMHVGHDNTLKDTQKVSKRMSVSQEYQVFKKRKFISPKAESLRFVVLPIPESPVLRRVWKTKTNLVEFKFVVENYTNSVIDRINFEEEYKENQEFLSLIVFVQELAVYINKNVIAEMAHGDFDGAYILLSCIKTLIELKVFDNLDFLEEKILTYNNIAVCLKNYAMYEISLKYMMLVLQFEKYRPAVNYESIILAEINICAIMSQMERHSEAINHAILAIKILDTANEKRMVVSYNSSVQVVEPNCIRHERFCELKAIAFFNLACEFEFMHDAKEALNYFKRAIDAYEGSSDIKPSFMEKLNQSYRNCRDSLLRQIRIKHVIREPAVVQRLTDGFGKSTFTRNMKLVRDFYANDTKQVKDVMDATKNYNVY